MGIDLDIKFNRALALALIDRDVVEANALYRQYLSYLKSLGETNEIKSEIQNTKIVFANKLQEFVSDIKNQNKTAELITAYQELISQFPRNFDFLSNLANCLLKLGQYDIALEVLARAEKVNPTNIKTKKEILNCLFEMKCYPLAKNKADEILVMENDDADNFCNLSKAYHFLYLQNNDENCLKQAILNAEIANKMKPNQKIYLKNLCVLYLFNKDFKTLDKIWEELIKLPDINDDDYFDYACHLLRKGEIKKGFEFYEARIKSPNMLKKYPKFNKPIFEFDTQKVKTLLIQAEQGIGDSFLFARYIPLIKNRAEKIILRVPNTIVEIMKRSFLDIEVISEEESCIDKLNFDYHLPLMSLPFVLGLDINDIYQKEKYLFADDKKIEYFKNKYFTSDKLKIGFCFEGKKGGMEIRNIPFNELKPLFDINAEFFALQYGINDEFYSGLNVKNLSSELKTFDDTLAILENLDLLITVDNSILNLAGASFKKTFAIFNDVPEFRWFNLTGDDVKWYKTVKPYCAEKFNDFKPVIQKIKTDIEAMI